MIAPGDVAGEVQRQRPNIGEAAARQELIHVGAGAIQIGKDDHAAVLARAQLAEAVATPCGVEGRKHPLRDHRVKPGQPGRDGLARPVFLAFVRAFLAFVRAFLALVRAFLALGRCQIERVYLGLERVYLGLSEREFLGSNVHGSNVHGPRLVAEALYASLVKLGAIIKTGLGQTQDFRATYSALRPTYSALRPVLVSFSAGRLRVWMALPILVWVLIYLTYSPLKDNKEAAYSGFFSVYH